MNTGERMQRMVEDEIIGDMTRTGFTRLVDLPVETQRLIAKAFEVGGTIPHVESVRFITTPYSRKEKRQPPARRGPTQGRWG